MNSGMKGVQVIAIVILLLAALTTSGSSQKLEVLVHADPLLTSMG